jgi:hypothetical protein
LIATINAIRERENKDRKFLAALQGIDMDEVELEQQEAKQDVRTLTGMQAAEAGFGVGMGLGVLSIEGVVVV